MPVNSANINFPALKEWNDDDLDYVPGLNTGFTIKVFIDKVQIVPGTPASCSGTIDYIIEDEEGNTVKATRVSLGGVG